MNKKEQVRHMFDDISGRYDFLNHFLSFGVDYRWRRKFVNLLAGYKPSEILDVATGTGDLALLMCSDSQVRVTGIDLAAGMLAIAEKKAQKAGYGDRITFQQGDAEHLPYPDNVFDAVTVAFGVRNFEDLGKGLSEMRRVLKSGGVMMVLEFSHPGSFPWKQAYGFYSRFVIPVIGRTVSKNKHAYSYLPESVAAFPSGEDFQRIMREAGLKNTTGRPLTFGISTIYTGEK
jgi:demethylmenaquinone methyltransferase / 2-methoxy-6-polyprenyl-1,4-benzoquinol methylase